MFHRLIRMIKNKYFTPASFIKNDKEESLSLSLFQCTISLKKLIDFVNVFLPMHSKFKKGSNNNSTQNIGILGYKRIQAHTVHYKAKYSSND